MAIIWKSKSFLDSIDRKDNKFKLIHILTGYTYNRSYRKEYLNIDPPLGTLQFNTVQGLTVDLNGFYSKRVDEKSRALYHRSPDY